MLLPFQGVTAPTRDTQGVASLALGILCYPPNFTHTFCVNICNYLIAQVGGTDTYFSS